MVGRQEQRERWGWRGSPTPSLTRTISFCINASDDSSDRLEPSSIRILCAVPARTSQSQQGCARRARYGAVATRRIPAESTNHPPCLSRRKHKTTRRDTCCPGRCMRTPMGVLIRVVVGRGHCTGSSRTNQIRHVCQADLTVSGVTPSKPWRQQGLRSRRFSRIRLHASSPRRGTEWGGG